MRPTSFSISYFKCTECGNTIPLPRIKSARRKKNHIKDLYCPFCNEVRKTREIREGDYEQIY